jgi:transcriptional regulator with GAF, ATPase, and Fis domain
MIDEPASEGTAPVPDVARDLLSPFIELLPVHGASISVLAGASQSTLGASDALAARLEQLQFELGEGPHWEALHSGEPVLVPDVRERRSSWPVFCATASELEVGAIFAYPLTLGAVVVGVVDLYRSSAGDLSPSDRATARSLAAVAASTAVRLAALAATEDQPQQGAWSPELRRVVHQATGMVLVQLDVTATEAFARLRAHAFATGATLESVAQDVVARRLTLDDPAAGS